MHVQLPGVLSSLADKVFHKETKKTQNKTPECKVKFGQLSFMSIPSVAFKSNLVIPNLPKGLKPYPEARLQVKDTMVLKQTSEEPEIGYKIYPQDPLVTKPEMFYLKGSVVPGPENNRIKAVDEKSEVAKPDTKGNYVNDVSTPQFDRTSAFALAQKTLKMHEKALGREIPWAFHNSQLSVHPRAGIKMNAYYSRWEQVIKLFYFQNRFKPNETCYTAKMADVVTHETGHAILDGLRPSYVGWGSHGGAIHEGFGDSCAMLFAMSSNSVIDKVIKQTGGDLKKENLIASLGEQFGKAVYGDRMYLRNAINNLKMSDFKTGRESDEVHNFGRLFGAMFYDIIVEMAYKHAEKMPLKDALQKTQEDLTKILSRAMGDFSPPGNIYYDDVAKAFLKADQVDFDGKYKDILVKVFKNREILNDSTIKSWEAEQTSVPALRLPPKTIESKQTIVDFVNNSKEQLNLPSTNIYRLESAYTNDFGETFLQLKASKKIPVPGPGKFFINMYDGLTLGFNRAGELFYKAENQTREFEIENAIADVQRALSKQESAGENVQPSVYKTTEEGNNILVKPPVIDDPVKI